LNEIAAALSAEERRMEEAAAHAHAHSHGEVPPALERRHHTHVTLLKRMTQIAQSKKHHEAVTLQVRHNWGFRV
jgi:predicted ATPase